VALSNRRIADGERREDMQLRNPGCLPQPAPSRAARLIRANQACATTSRTSMFSTVTDVGNHRAGPLTHGLGGFSDSNITMPIPESSFRAQ
jgi:hypothetical protein